MSLSTGSFTLDLFGEAFYVRKLQQGVLLNWEGVFLSVFCAVGLYFDEDESVRAGFLADGDFFAAIAGVVVAGTFCLVIGFGF